MRLTQCEIFFFTWENFGRKFQILNAMGFRVNIRSAFCLYLCVKLQRQLISEGHKK